MAIPLDQREREELCDLFLELGPDAPTLDEGWVTADLAAHLVVRERDPRASVGILRGKGRAAALTAKLQAREKAKGYEAVVARVRSGPPRLLRIEPLRTYVNLSEYFIHHEDVRRANGRTRRTDRPDLDDALWRLLGKTGRFMARRVRGAGLELRRPGGESLVVGKAEPRAVLTGHPSELVLYLSGRRGAADVELSGPPEAVRTVEGASLGL